MTREVIFAKTRHHYDSYQDFWSLVKLSGYKTCYFDEVDICKEDTIYITTPINGDTREHLKNHVTNLHDGLRMFNENTKTRNAHLILWQLERPADSGGSIPQYGKDNRDLWYQRYFDEIWVSDQQLAAETGLRFVPLGSHPNLGSPSGIGHKHYDAVHMSYIVPRREAKYIQIKKLAPNAWGDRRDQVLKQSRCAINIHQDTYPFCEPLRFALFAAYGLPVVSERVKDTMPYQDKIVWRDYDDVIPTLYDGLKDAQRLYDYGMAFREFLCVENNFRKWVDKAIFEDGIWK